MTGETQINWNGADKSENDIYASLMASHDRVCEENRRLKEAGSAKNISIITEWPELSGREELSLSAWLKRHIPPKDLLLGHLLSTTARVLLIGQTGIGKTLISLDMAGGVASCKGFLCWEGKRPARVMYLDGEMSADTFKERLEIVSQKYGEDISLYAYSREVLGEDEMPPLDTSHGQAWLMREIKAVKPDVIFFDSIMCLVGGVMSEETSWEPIKKLVRKLSSMRIGQVWLHHTGHDASHGFGTKTREWEMDTVIMLTKVEAKVGEEGVLPPFQLEFTKARNRTPHNFQDFPKLIISRGEDDFIYSHAGTDDDTRNENKAESTIALVRRWYLEAYNILANDVEPSLGFGGDQVRKVGVKAIQKLMKQRGWLAVDDSGNVDKSSKTNLNSAKNYHLSKSGFVEFEGFIWATRPSKTNL